MDLRVTSRKATIPWVTCALRGSAAIVLTVASLVALRNRYHGSCVVPGDSLGDGDFLLFLLLPVLFLIGFVWALSELAYPLLLAMGVRLPRVAAIALGLGVYGIVGWVAWLMWPVPVDIHEQDFRAFVSAFWSLGFLLETGNFSHHSCGY